MVERGGVKLYKLFLPAVTPANKQAPLAELKLVSATLSIGILKRLANC